MIRLVVALHGVGASAADIAPMADTIGRALSVDALALDGPDRFDMGGIGRQWFSVRGVTDVIRPARVAAALPGLLARLDEAGARRGCGRGDIALIGFSQGAIMALAALAGGAGFGSVVAIAGRLAAPVLPASPAGPKTLLIHDRLDPVMPIALGIEAEAALRTAGHDTTLAITEGYGHAIGPRTIEAALVHLRHPSTPQEI